MKTKLVVGDKFEGVLLETVRTDNESRPRVRPLEYFESDIKVEFPRHLRVENPIGTRFIANVKVSQKTKNGEPFGKPYLVATDSSIIKIDNFTPNCNLYAVKLNTAGDRAYEYILKEHNVEPEYVSFKNIRQKAYEMANVSPSHNSKSVISTVNRLELIKSYALSRAAGKCEACEKDAPFFKRNGQAYLEVHHILELKNGGGDTPLNVIAICPNCHARVTHGEDGKEYNKNLFLKIKELELSFE